MRLLKSFWPALGILVVTGGSAARADGLQLSHLMGEATGYKKTGVDLNNPQVCEKMLGDAKSNILIPTQAGAVSLGSLSSLVFYRQALARIGQKVSAAQSLEGIAQSNARANMRLAQAQPNLRPGTNGDVAAQFQMWRAMINSILSDSAQLESAHQSIRAATTELEHVIKSSINPNIPITAGQRTALEKVAELRTNLENADFAEVFRQDLLQRLEKMPKGTNGVPLDKATFENTMTDLRQLEVTLAESTAKVSDGLSKIGLISREVSDASSNVESAAVRRSGPKAGEGVPSVAEPDVSNPARVFRVNSGTSIAEPSFGGAGAIRGAGGALTVLTVWQLVGSPLVGKLIQNSRANALKGSPYDDAAIFGPDTAQVCQRARDNPEFKEAVDLRAGTDLNWKSSQDEIRKQEQQLGLIRAGNRIQVIDGPDGTPNPEFFKDPIVRVGTGS